MKKGQLTILSAARDQVLHKLKNIFDLHRYIILCGFVKLSNVQIIQTFAI
jgi:hypothetical protein